MYPIITEKGLREDGQIEYDVFGVKVISSKNIEEALKNAGYPDLLRANNKPILANIKKENESPNIFFTRSVKGTLSFQEFLNSPEQDLLNFNSIVFNSLLCTQKSYYPEVYDEILSLAESFFIINKKIPLTSLCVSSTMALYFKLFKEIGFSLQKGTKGKIVVSRPNITCEWQGANINILKANTIALMLLTNQTSYFEDGTEYPIILDGIERTPTTWEVISPKELRLGQIPNPYGCKKGHLLKPGK